MATTDINVWDNTNHQYTAPTNTKSWDGVGPNFELTLNCKNKVLGGVTNLQINFSTISFKNGDSTNFKSSIDNRITRSSISSEGGGISFSVSSSSISSSINVLNYQSNKGMVIKNSSYQNPSFTFNTYSDNGNLTWYGFKASDPGYYYSNAVTEAIPIQATGYNTSENCVLYVCLQPCQLINMATGDVIAGGSSGDYYVIKARYANNSGYVHNYWYYAPFSAATGSTNWTNTYKIVSSSISDSSLKIRYTGSAGSSETPWLLRINLQTY